MVSASQASALAALQGTNAPPPLVLAEPGAATLRQTSDTRRKRNL